MNGTDNSSPGESCAQVSANDETYAQGGRASLVVRATDPQLDVLGQAYLRGGGPIVARTEKFLDRAWHHPAVQGWLLFLSMWGGGAAGGAEGGLAEGAVEISANEIMFSQQSINDAAEIIESMEASGWVGGPVDVVSIDGKLVTLDNTRVFAAQQAGIRVQAVVHDAAETISPERGQAFLEQYGTRPSTWGEAVQQRIDNQSSGFRNAYPQGSPYTGVKN